MERDIEMTELLDGSVDGGGYGIFVGYVTGLEEAAAATFFGQRLSLLDLDVTQADTAAFTHKTFYGGGADTTGRTGY